MWTLETDFVSNKEGRHINVYTVDKISFLFLQFGSIVTLWTKVVETTYLPAPKVSPGKSN